MRQLRERARGDDDEALAETLAAMQQWQQARRGPGAGAIDWLNGRAMSPGQYHLELRTSSDEGAGARLRLVSEGLFGPDGRQARHLTRALIRLPAAETRPFTGLVGCEGVAVSGSGIIDSYDAREGAYGGDNARRGRATLGTISPEAWVTTSGASPIHGDVASSGGFRAQGSGTLHGNLKANGRVEIQGGGAVVYGNVASRSDVDISSSGTVQGDVATNGTLRLGNWSAWVEGDAVAAAAESVRDARDQVGGRLTLLDGGAGVPAVKASTECPRHGVGEQYAVYAPAEGEAAPEALSLVGGKRTVVLDAAGLHDPGDGTLDVVTELDDGRHLARFTSLRLGGSANLRVGSPGGPVDLVLWVPGELDIGGGGSFRVAEGSRLTIITASPFDLGSAIQLGDDAPSRVTEEGEVEAILTVISTYDDRDANQPGVKIRGASRFQGQVIAPFAEVDVGGSGDFHGAVNARRITVSGAGGFHYDESFGERVVDGSGDEASAGLPILEALW